MAESKSAALPLGDAPKTLAGKARPERADHRARGHASQPASHPPFLTASTRFRAQSVQFPASAWRRDRREARRLSRTLLRSERRQTRNAVPLCSRCSPSRCRRPLARPRAQGRRRRRSPPAYQMSECARAAAPMRTVIPSGRTHTATTTVQTKRASSAAARAGDSASSEFARERRTNCVKAAPARRVVGSRKDAIGRTTSAVATPTIRPKSVTIAPRSPFTFPFRPCEI